MKKLLVLFVVVALLIAFGATAFALPNLGPETMPEASIRGLHRTVFTPIPEFPRHIMIGLMIRTGIPCHD